ncbi:MAG: hypothetical protein KAT32_01130 [Candidatus Moranbacteria bacterium]|nr:hypothetical protein [Candidatus Moranbacteria bacterium]
MKNEKQLGNLEKVKMPWQGKTLIGFIIFCLITFIPLGLTFDDTSIAEDLLCSGSLLNSFSLMIGSVLLYFDLAVTPFFKFYVFINNLFISEVFYLLDIFFWIFLLCIFIYLITGFLKGFKKSILLFIFSLILEFFGSLYLLNEPREEICFKIFFFMIFVMSFSLYLSISCLKHPYYNQNKKTKEIKI